jgi:hypothetical protein
LRTAVQLVAIGSAMGSSGASTATATKKNTIRKPSSALLLRFSFFQARLSRRAGRSSAASMPAVSLAAVIGRSSCAG